MDVTSFANAIAGIDSKGRLLYAAGGFIKMPHPGSVGPQEVFVDSNPILRADLDARRVDTVARVANIKGGYSRIDRTEVGKIIRTALVGNLWMPMNYEVVPMKDISDYYPALRQGAVFADRDNNLWILPTTSAQ